MCVPTCGGRYGDVCTYMWWEVGDVCTYVHVVGGRGGCVYVCVYLRTCGGRYGNVCNQKTVLCGCHRCCMGVWLHGVLCYVDYTLTFIYFLPVSVYLISCVCIILPSCVCIILPSCVSAPYSVLQ